MAIPMDTQSSSSELSDLTPSPPPPLIPASSNVHRTDPPTNSPLPPPVTPLSSNGSEAHSPPMWYSTSSGANPETTSEKATIPAAVPGTPSKPRLRLIYTPSKNKDHAPLKFRRIMPISRPGEYDEQADLKAQYEKTPNDIQTTYYTIPSGCKKGGRHIVTQIYRGPNFKCVKCDRTPLDLPVWGYERQVVMGERRAVGVYLTKEIRVKAAAEYAKKEKEAQNNEMYQMSGTTEEEDTVMGDGDE